MVNYDPIALVVTRGALPKDLAQVPVYGICLITGNKVAVKQVPLSKYIEWGAIFDWSLDMYVI